MPRAYACIRQYQSTRPPLVDRDRFVAVKLAMKCQQVYQDVNNI